LSAGGAISSASATPLPDPARLPQQFMMMESPAEDMLEAIDSKQVGKLNKLTAVRLNIDQAQLV